MDEVGTALIVLDMVYLFSGLVSCLIQSKKAIPKTLQNRRLRTPAFIELLLAVSPIR